MKPFQEKAIFIWCYWDMFNGDVQKIAQSLVDAHFEAAYVHTNDGPREGAYDGKLNCTPELVKALKDAGLTVYGWGAPYGISLQGEIDICVRQTKRYQLAGYIFDAETTWDTQPNSNSNAVKLITEYQKQCPGVPTAWCWWPFYNNPYKPTQIYHPVNVLQAAMQYVDVGMPMAYWSWGDDVANVTRYLDQAIAEWRAVTNKPLVVAGRAWTGDGGTPTYNNVTAYEQEARKLGCVGISWWDMQHAVTLPDCWKALSDLHGFRQEETTMTNAIGLYTDNADWTNTAFDFIAGYAGKSWLDTPANLKAIDEKASAEGKPFFVWYDFSVDFYSRGQFMAKDEFWPPVASDEPLQNLILVMQNRNISGVIISVQTSVNHDGKAEQPAYISYASKVFVGRANDWLKAHKPDVKLIVASSNAFISTKSPDINNWVGNYNTCAVQPTAKPLVNALPDPADKPAYLDNRPTCEFWRYYEYPSNSLALLTYRMGDRASLWKWLNFSVGSPTPPPDTGGTPTVDPAVLTRLTTLEKRVDDLVKLLQSSK